MTCAHPAVEHYTPLFITLGAAARADQHERRWSRHLPAAPTSVTVIRDAAGRYFASFVVTTTDQPLPPVDAEVGIDLGLTHYAVLSNGRKITAPRYLRRAARKLRRLQQDLSRKQRGSNNRTKAVVKVAVLPGGLRHQPARSPSTPQLTGES